MIIAVNDREIDRSVAQGMGCLQSAKSCSNYHHAWHFRQGLTSLNFNFMLCAHLCTHILCLAHRDTSTSSVIAYITDTCLATKLSKPQGFPILKKNLLRLANLHPPEKQVVAERAGRAQP